MIKVTTTRYGEVTGVDGRRAVTTRVNTPVAASRFAKRKVETRVGPSLLDVRVFGTGSTVPSMRVPVGAIQLSDEAVTVAFAVSSGELIGEPLGEGLHVVFSEPYSAPDAGALNVIFN
jgi:hypothetical protein